MKLFLMNSLTKYKLILIAVLLTVSNAQAQNALGIFSETGFPDLPTDRAMELHRLEVIDNNLYAASADGIYKYDDALNGWSQWALAGYDILDFKKSGDYVLAVTVGEIPKYVSAPAVAKIIRYNLRTKEINDVMDSGMGYRDGGMDLTYVMRLAQHPQNPNKLAAAVYPGIWITEDFGTTWKLNDNQGVYGYNENQFLGWHPEVPGLLFYTSENGFMQAEIGRSENDGKDWTFILPDPSGDNSVHHLAFDPSNPGHILYSGEGTLYASFDYGKNWECKYQEDFDNNIVELGYAYNVFFDHSDPSRVYAIGCKSVDNYINIFCSEDGGDTWKKEAQSESFNNYDYWVNESVFYKNAVYLYTKNGVLKYSPSFYSGLNNIESNPLTDSADYYDLKGIRITKPQKGQIYIKEGEKFIFK